MAIQVAFTSGSYEYLQSLHNALRGRGIQGGSLYLSKKGNYARLALSIKDALKIYGIMYNTPHKLYLRRKKIVLNILWNSDRKKPYYCFRRSNVSKLPLSSSFAVVAQLVSSTRLSRGRLPVQVRSTAQKTKDPFGVFCFAVDRT